MSDTLDLTKAMIARPSVSPADGGCQELMIGRLEPLGFQVERMPFGNVENFWATRRFFPFWFSRTAMPARCGRGRAQRGRSARTPPWCDPGRRLR